MSDEKKGRGQRVLATTGVVITVLAGATGLLFTIDADLKPCIGADKAEFTGAPVFPGTSSFDFQKNGPDPPTDEELKTETDTRGAEVRLTFSTSGLRGQDLQFRSSLVAIKADGTLGAVDPDYNRVLGETVSPDACDEVVGRDFFVPIAHPKRRYRVVIELYRTDRNERLALTQTAIFSL